MEQGYNAADELQSKITPDQNLGDASGNIPERNRGLELQEILHILRKSGGSDPESKKNRSPKPDCCVHDAHESEKPDHGERVEGGGGSVEGVVGTQNFKAQVSTSRKPKPKTSS